MRALVQTVSRASVTVDGTVTGAIEDGLLVLLGVTHSDSPAIARQLARKVYELRILDDEQPYTFLFARKAVSPVDRRFRGVEVLPRGLWPLDWWVPPALQKYGARPTAN